MAGPDLLRSPLHDRHVGLGARLAEFGGWEMPIQYTGVVDEHMAVRERVGLFDVSHLGNVEVSGPGAKDFVNTCLTNDLDRIGPGQAQYTLCCDEASGGVVDDLIAYYSGDIDLHLVPNAANTREVIRRLAAVAPDDVSVIDQHREFAIIAVQGPRSADVLGDVGLDADLAYMSFRVVERGEVRLIVCRTGYTGERGYELIVPSDAATGVWDELIASVSSYDGLPCGLGARDTLRTEMGYPLHGQDLSLDITPVQARSGWAVGWDKPRFWGQEVLRRERSEGARRVLWGLRSDASAIPRPHMAVKSHDGQSLGDVTSGTFSPTLRVGIGLALLDRSVGEGQEVLVDIRGRTAPMTVVRPPFVASHVR
jgi:aminomethyltransferase